MSKIFEGELISLAKEEQVAVITLDKKDSEMNIISAGIMDEFMKVMDLIQSDDQIKAVVLISGKSSFMAGADINEFLTLGPGEAAKVAREGHDLFLKISNSKKPFVAAIHGACMGGGTEISLACAGRIASNEPSTIMALPEVKLGLLPGLGGTLRLPRLIGIQKALNMMLTGRNIYARQALKYGLVDVMVDRAKLLTAAKKHALDIASGKFKRKDKRSLVERSVESPMSRNVIFKKAAKMVQATTKGNYPAPFKILESVQYGMSHSIEEGILNETKLFDELLQTPESRQLIYIFFAMTDLKKNPWKDQVRPIQQVGVLGAGLMGEGIAEVSLNKSMQVHLKDISSDMLTTAKRNIWRALDKKRKRRIISSSQSEKLMHQLYTHLDYQAFGQIPIVIEAVFEDLDLKHRVLKEVERNTPRESIFASNTSALPISRIAEGSSRPENVIGMHYFSPVQKMPLLEIIVTDKTADWVKATALDIGIRQGKTCIIVKDGPGFYTTRILAPFMNEALLMIQEGVDIMKIEAIMKQFGFPVGPITLIDEVGIDVGAHINEGDLGKFFENRGEKGSDVLNILSAEDFKGRKNKKGFWMYDETGKKIKGRVNEEIFRHIEKKESDLEATEIQFRMAMIMANEAVHCLHEGILDSARDGDIGAVFGLGFPPFLGGPFRYLDGLGIDKSLQILDDLTKKWGNRFTPSPLLTQMKQEGKTFYS